MHIFSDEGSRHEMHGYMLIIATSIEDAAVYFRRFAGQEPHVQWTQVDDEEELTIRLHDIPVTRTASEWIDQGRGILALMEPGVWWLRGRDWIENNVGLCVS